MKKLLLISLLLISISLAAQKTAFKNNTNGLPIQVQLVENSSKVTSPDITITTTDGTSRNLYTVLGQGKSVLIDLFFTTCSYCIQYAPIVDQAYVASGSGAGNVQFWGISDRDNNAAVIAYKAAHGVSNPCAGTDGGGAAATTAFSTISGTSFTGWPTYSIVCPNKTLYFDVNYPPTATGFDVHFTNCGTSGIDDKSNTSKIINVYPVPINSNSFVDFYLNKAGRCSFMIFDMMGKQIAAYELGKLAEGNHSFEFPFVSLPNGNYILKIQTDNDISQNQKIVIIH
ncbi:MAG: T9SS type A sorting domain-containing protein [Bacteroidetes bacterium]|nr:T9SS type A sorting domain-containing protein [Bacteroidota bacterium]